MRILLVHQNFPGQFRELAPALMNAGHELRAVSMRPEPRLAGVANLPYRPARGNTPGLPAMLLNTESAVLRGEAVAQRVDALVREGWRPDVVLGHTGWGEMLFLRELLPRARMVGFSELYYRTSGGDVGFDPVFPAAPDAARRLAVRNMHLASSLMACDAGVTPTHWQAGCFPELLRSRLQVIHDGIATDRLTPDPSATWRVGTDGPVLRTGDEVVTFVSRSLEPMRGYHRFMRALPSLMKRRPRARVVIVGADGVSYDAAAPGGGGYKQRYLDEVKDRIDLSRVHFVDRIPYDSLVALLRVSAVHVYLTMPFVLSWSMLEAMSLGALVVGSATPPVQEVVEHGRNGLLVDFFDAGQLADTVADALARPAAFASLRQAARETVVQRYDLRRVSLPAYKALLGA